MKPNVIWRWPLLLAAVTLFGLVAALLGEGGVWWGLSWTALAIPLVVMAFYVLRHGLSRRRSSGT